MMPVIRVSDSTWERMKRHARPLEDTADDIVKRALDALEGKTQTVPVKRSTMGRPSKSEEGNKLPQKEFREPLLITLNAMGGSAKSASIREAMYPLVEKRLSAADHVIMVTGEPRWWNATCWERSNLVKEGYFRSNSPRGMWELSDQGKVEAIALGRLKR
jgi:hypothetical protein